MGIEEFLTEPRQPSAGDRVDLNGRWKNGLGSEMTLSVAPNGAVTGTYRTGVGLPSPSEEFPLTGYVERDLLAFVVNFGRYGSLAGWVGQHTVAGGKERIETLWHLARDVPEAEETTALWAGILAGANLFERA
jgi:hypothetical protein